MEDKKLNDLLNKLALKLNTTAERLYVVMIKQVKVDAINSCIITFFILTGGFVLRYFWNILDGELVPGLAGDGSWPSQVYIKFTVLLIISVVWAVMFVYKLAMTSTEVVNAWLNPEGVAFNRIIRYFN